MASDEIGGDFTARRVVVTGMGIIAPNGQDLDAFWDTLCKGRSAAKFVTRFDTSGLPTRVAAEVASFDARQYMDAKTARRSTLAVRYSLAASSLAVRDAGVNLPALDPDRLGVVEGTTVGSIDSAFRGYQNYILQGGYAAQSVGTVVNGYGSAGSDRIALHLGIKGHALTYCSGCASGNEVIAYAAQMIQQDEADVMLAGATDDLINEPVFAGLCLLKVMTRRNENAAQAMRPFDRCRDGFLAGEGSGFLVLEELSHALARKARIYAEVIGYGRSCEAFHATDPHPEGLGLRRAMEKALRRARIHPSEVDYINAHGSATSANDSIETGAIRRVFGSHAGRLAVSATKPVTGHLLGAAGALETVICALAIHRRQIPPTINRQVPDETCDLDYVTNGLRSYPVRVAMNLSTGFGGKNACLILKEYRSAG